MNAKGAKAGVSKGTFGTVDVKYAVTKVRSGTSFPKKPESWQQIIAIDTDGPFTVTQQTLPTGELALVLVPRLRSPFRFLDLPPEIRNMIYEMVLVQERSSYSVTGAGKLRENYPAILSVGGIMSQEASTIFYSSKIFDVLSLGSLYHFLKTIGPASAKQISRVVITTTWSKGHTISLRNLMMPAAATNLQLLDFERLLKTTTGQNRGPTASQFADDFEIIFRAVYRRCKDFDELFTIIRFGDGHCEKVNNWISSLKTRVMKDLKWARK